MIILGVSGKARTGKGEFAKIACDEYAFKKLSFAGSLKQEVADFLNKWNVEWRHENLYGENSSREEILKITMECIDSDVEMCDFFKFFGLTRGIGKDGFFHFTPRSLMQWWGTEFRRAQDPDYWVKKTINEIKNDKSNSRFIIDDLRFENEAIELLNNNAKLIRIERPNNPFTVSNPNHESEIGLDNWIEWHYVIENSSTIDEYVKSIYFVLDEVLGDDK